MCILAKTTLVFVSLSPFQSVCLSVCLSACLSVALFADVPTQDPPRNHHHLMWFIFPSVAIAALCSMACLTFCLVRACMWVHVLYVCTYIPCDCSAKWFSVTVWVHVSACDCMWLHVIVYAGAVKYVHVLFMASFCVFLAAGCVAAWEELTKASQRILLSES